MSESKVYIVSARVLAMRQQDLSKMRGKVNLYTYLDLQILEGHEKSNPDHKLEIDTCHITRRAVPGDEHLQDGDVLQLELGVGKIEQPQYCTWIKRLD